MDPRRGDGSRAPLRGAGVGNRIVPGGEGGAVSETPARPRGITGGRLALVALLLILLPGSHLPPETLPGPFCREEEENTLDMALEWWTPPRELDRSLNHTWCAAVGGPVVLAPSVGRSVESDVGVDDLVLVSWNVHVGGGSLNHFITDLRSGGITGRPEPHFVLMVQEAYREGGTIPGVVPRGARKARVLVKEPEDDRRRDIVSVAESHGLSLVYVPSMRNGRGPEDRGNAILSTLPLRDPLAVELPFELQRRVAVSARLEGTGSDGEPWSLRVVSTHLAHRSTLTRLGESLGEGRLRQAMGLLEALPAEEPTLLGGDFNTWWGGPDEPAVQLIQREFAEPFRRPEQQTYRTEYPLGSAVLDYMFFRIPEPWQAAYRRMDATFGSDHYPLLGRLRFSTPSRGQEVDG
jgi:endonuclease/exonuclease/phosphatase family metal-dependent hydrolase